MLDDKENNLVEDLSIPGKIFFAALASFVTNKGMNPSYLKIKGTPEQIKALGDAAAASKKLIDEINNPGTTIEKVIQCMNDKRQAAIHFEEVTGHPWPL
jgi:hypothetical protein